MKTNQTKSDHFLDFLIAAMLDAAQERKLTQLKTTITPPGESKEKIVRIIVIPEELDVEWPQGLGKMIGEGGE